MLREAYRRFRHSHKLCREWLPAMLRLGDTVYAMTIMRQAGAPLPAPLSSSVRPAGVPGCLP